MDNIKLPHNISAERAIFSIILTDPDRFIEIADKLRVGDFYSLTSQEIWQAMRSIYLKGNDIDAVSIKSEISKQEIDTKPALTELCRCYEGTVSKGNLMSFVKEVKDKSMLRQIIGMTNKYLEDSKLEEANPLNILGRIEKNIVDLSEQIKDDRPTNAKGILGEIKIDIEKGMAEGWKGFDTGLEPLDRRTGGFLPTHTWIIGGYTSLGKTFFVLQLALNVLRQGAKVMIFSTEMDRKMIVLRMLGNLAGLGTINILKGNIDEADKAELADAEKLLAGYKDNLLIYDNVYTLEEIRLKAKKEKIRNGLDIIIVDFIQNLRGEASIYERMSNAAIRLQQIAQELNITMIITSQVTQSSAGWGGKEAIEYKGAGEIAAVADVGLWINRVKDDKDARRIILRKVRHGSPARFDVRFLFPSGRVVVVQETEEG